MTGYPLLNLFWTMLEFFLWVLWFFLLFKVITDIFRSRDLGGWGKAGWMILCIIVPFLGVLVYVIVRGRSMQERDIEQAQRAESAFKQYVREAATTPETGADAAAGGGAAPGHVGDLQKLADLKSSGVLNEEEFQRAKDKLLAQ
jgi:hypothetical protein